MIFCWRLVGVAGLCAFAACQSAPARTDNMGQVFAGKEDSFFTTRVQVRTVEMSDFEQQIFTNGKLESLETQVIKFPFNEKISRINVKNGQYVHKSQLMAELDKTAALRKLVRTKDAWERAVIALDDKLIDYGYRLADTARVPPGILKMAKIKSSYTTSWLDLEEVRYEVAQADITAPVDGVVSGLEAKTGSYAETYNMQFCTLISNSKMLVSFTLLESDIVYLKEGMAVTVNSYGGKNKILKGHLHAINPVVDKDGMIKVQAIVSVPADNGYLSGMNVKVCILNTIPAKISIPKEAIVQKQNGKVVYTFENGVAKLNYVETGPDNEKYIVINTGLKAGQQIIVSNPELLTNGAAVIVDK